MQSRTRLRMQIIALILAAASVFAMSRGGWAKVSLFLLAWAVVFLLWPVLMGLRAAWRSSR